LCAVASEVKLSICQLHQSSRYRERLNEHTRRSSQLNSAGHSWDSCSAAIPRCRASARAAAARAAAVGTASDLSASTACSWCWHARSRRPDSPSMQQASRAMMGLPFSARASAGRIASAAGAAFAAASLGIVCWRLMAWAGWLLHVHRHQTASRCQHQQPESD